MKNLKMKWVMRYDKNNKQFRFFRVCWEANDKNPSGKCSYKISVSIKNLMPRITLRKSLGGVYV